MKGISRKHFVGVFLWVVFLPLIQASSTTLSERLWQELELAKSPQEISSETIDDKPAKKENLSPADLAFMEAELEEDSVSTGMAAPVRKQEITPQRRRSTPFRVRGRDLNLYKDKDTLKDPSPIIEGKSQKRRERSR